MKLADTVMMGTMMVVTTTTIDVTFLHVDMAVMMMEAETVMEIDVVTFLLDDMVVMMMEAGTVMEIDATFLLVDMVVMTGAGTVMETTMTTTDANYRVLKRLL